VDCVVTKVGSHFLSFVRARDSEHWLCYDDAKIPRLADPRAADIVALFCHAEAPFEGNPFACSVSPEPNLHKRGMGRGF
jgi:hypothetical protein